MLKPFLLRFAKKCISPARVEHNRDFIYDSESDIVICTEGSTRVPAVQSSRGNGPETKKCDIEKGDDLKDRRMWN